VHKKARKHSAVLLLLAPVLAIGSSFLVASGASATTPKSVSPTLTICKSVSGSFHFTLNGKLLSLSKSCTAVAAKVGVNKVVETSTPASYRTLAAISVSPNSDRVNASLRTATVTVKLAAGKIATVRFVNAKAVSQVGGNAGAEQTSDGSIEVCKVAGDGWVVGTFPFTVTQSSATVATVNVATGQCSAAIPVAAGTPVTVTETAPSPYYVSAVSAVPAGNITADTLGASSGVAGSGNGSGTFTIASGEITVANFTNSTAVGWVKVCKVLQDDQGSLAGTTFNFNLKWSFAPPTEAATAAPITGSGTVGVIAVDSSIAGGACAFPYGNSGWVNGIPVGATVWITEATNPTVDVAVTNVVVNPAGAAVTTPAPPAGEAVVTVQASQYVVDATFTNDPLGVIEVCKNFDPRIYDATNSATFTVNGGSPVTVRGGECSAPIWVPAGTATVSEASDPNFYLESVSTQSASDPMGTRLLTGPTVNPANVLVPYGGVGGETVVTFTNAVDPSQFKICKQETSADAALSGATFDFTWTFNFSDTELDTADLYGGDRGTSLTIGPVTPTDPTGLVCSGLFDGPPAILPDGGTASITVTETPTDLPGVQATGYTYQGNGGVIADGTSTFPVVVSDGASANVEFTPGAGINIITFTNGSTGAAGYPVVAS